MEKTDKKKFICIKSPSSKINVGDIVYLLQDNTTIYNTTTKSAVYEHSKYLNDSRYFEEYDKTIKELITVPDIVFEKSKDVTFEKSKVKAISLEEASKAISKTIEHPSHYTSHHQSILNRLLYSKAFEILYGVEKNKVHIIPKDLKLY